MMTEVLRERIKQELPRKVELSLIAFVALKRKHKEVTPTLMGEPFTSILTVWVHSVSRHKAKEAMEYVLREYFKGVV